MREMLLLLYFFVLGWLLMTLLVVRTIENTSGIHTDMLVDLQPIS